MQDAYVKAYQAPRRGPVRRSVQHQNVALQDRIEQHRLASLVSEDSSEARDQRRLNAFTRELGLTEAQRQQVQRIVDSYRPERERRARSMFQGCGKPLMQLEDAMDAEIRNVLEPQQRPRFDALRERRRRFHQQGKR